MVGPSGAYPYTMTRDVPNPPKDHEVTPESVYFNRRTFLKAGAIAATAAATGAVYARLNGQPAKTKQTAALAGLESGAGPTTGPAAYPADVVAAFHTDQKPTPYQTVTHYNNFYEFGTSKSDPAQNVGDFKTAGWKVQVDGMCSNPTTFDFDDLMKVSRPQERVYRFRCVEAWSMVIPWAGYSLSKVVESRGQATERGEVRGVHDAARSENVSGSEDRRAAMAVRRGAADGRGDAPVDAVDHGAVRAGAAPTAGRSAGAVGDSVEIWIQRHQVDREDFSLVAEHAAHERGSGTLRAE